MKPFTQILCRQSPDYSCYFTNVFTPGFNETTRIPLESRFSRIFMHTWGATTTVLPPAEPEVKHGRFKGKYVNGKTTGQMIKITGGLTGMVQLLW